MIMQNSEKISRDQVRDVPSLILVTEELMDRIDMLEKLILDVLILDVPGNSPTV